MDGRASAAEGVKLNLLSGNGTASQWSFTAGKAGGSDVGRGQTQAGSGSRRVVSRAQVSLPTMKEQALNTLVFGFAETGHVSVQLTFFS